MEARTRLLVRLATSIVLAVPAAIGHAQPLPTERLQAELAAAVTSPDTQVQAAVLAVRRPGGLQAIGHLGSTAGYFALVGSLPGLDATLALAIDAQLDPTPVLVAAITALTSQDP